MFQLPASPAAVALPAIVTDADLERPATPEARDLDEVDRVRARSPRKRAPLRMYSSPYRARSGRRGMIHVVQSLGDVVRSIVEDLLVLARADAGRVALERSPVRLDIVATEVAEAFLPAAAERGLSVSADCRDPVLVHGDERWLRQLLVNLVDNAVKFSTTSTGACASGWVRVEVAESGAVASLSVSDSGPGVPEESLDRIFDRFYRADTVRTYRGIEGCGLGLAIAAWIVDAHGGTIRAENKPGGGSRFIVTVPLAPA